MNYYGRFYRSKCVQVLRRLNVALARWAQWKFKRFKRRERASMHWLGCVARRDPNRKGNKGSAGVDGMTVDDLRAHLKEHWPVS
jgi:hypothetical protein